MIAKITISFLLEINGKIIYKLNQNNKIRVILDDSMVKMTSNKSYPKPCSKYSMNKYPFI